MLCVILPGWNEIYFSRHQAISLSLLSNKNPSLRIYIWSERGEQEVQHEVSIIPSDCEDKWRFPAIGSKHVCKEITSIMCKSGHASIKELTSVIRHGYLFLLNNFKSVELGRTHVHSISPTPTERSSIITLTVSSAILQLIITILFYCFQSLLSALETINMKYYGWKIYW